MIKLKSRNFKFENLAQTTLPSPSKFTEERISVILTTTIEADFNTAFETFLSQGVGITLNSHYTSLVNNTNIDYMGRCSMKLLTTVNFIQRFRLVLRH
ncbi:hypothetical protein A0H81_02237 [Grifola frondosa]|uniref:Uncharacterized protein n=1 Tax=Grifola frondosa TaxID=5627 RepID=A0A1C7ML15_GRIFR|nr:hypothetical protein A0H81_02237 [Grifola frondosa]